MKLKITKRSTPLKKLNLRFAVLVLFTTDAITSSSFSYIVNNLGDITRDTHAKTLILE